MHVIYFHQHFSSPKGAVGSRSYEMAQALIQAGHEVTMVCGRYAGAQTGLTGEFIKGKREGETQGIRVIEIDLPYSNKDNFLKRTLVFFRFAFKSILIAMTRKYDLVFATTTPLTAGIPGIFARWFRRKPFVFEVRDLWPELPKAMGVITNPVILKMMSALEFMSYRSAHACIGLAPGIVDGIEKRGVSRDKITLIPNGCDISIFSSASPKRPQSVKYTDLLAVYGGTHGAANGLHNVLNAARILIERKRDDIKILLIGSGKQKADLEKIKRKDKLDNVLMMNPMPKYELAEYFAGADIGLQMLDNIPAFYFGTSPNKFFDYISTGKPVLVNYPGWVANMIEISGCGYVVPPDNAAEFANALELAHTQKNQFPTMGKNALNLANTKFKRSLLANKFVEVLEGVFKNN